MSRFCADIIISHIMKATFVGICSIDLYSKCHRLPHIGETVHGIGLERGYGGKASNACAQFAMLCDSNMKPSLLTCVGKDDDGKSLLKHFKSININDQFIQVVDKVPTGIALCFVLDKGESAIIIHPCPVTKEIVIANAKHISSSNIVVTNFEIPLDATEETLRIAHEGGAKTILNTSPMPENLNMELFRNVSIVIANELEMSTLGQQDALFQFGVEAVVVTLGSDGACLYLPGKPGISIAAPVVDAVDTTGAGDSFLGAFAYGIAKGMSLEDASSVACVTASISVQNVGTQQSYPKRDHPQLKPLFYKVK